MEGRGVRNRTRGLPPLRHFSPTPTPSLGVVVKQEIEDDDRRRHHGVPLVYRRPETTTPSRSLCLDVWVGVLRLPCPRLFQPRVTLVFGPSRRPRPLPRLLGPVSIYPPSGASPAVRVTSQRSDGRWRTFFRGWLSSRRRGPGRWGTVCVRTCVCVFRVSTPSPPRKPPTGSQVRMVHSC